MVPGGLVAIAEDRVVEKIRKRSKGAVQAGFPGGPPIGVFENECDIFGRDLADARIEENAVVVEDEPGLKGIREGQQGKRTEGEGRQQGTGKITSRTRGMLLRDAPVLRFPLVGRSGCDAGTRRKTILSA